MPAGSVRVIMQMITLFAVRQHDNDAACFIVRDLHREVEDGGGRGERVRHVRIARSWSREVVVALVHGARTRRRERERDARERAERQALADAQEVARRAAEDDEEYEFYDEDG